MSQQHADVVVVGLGSAGAFALLHAARQGLKVIGIERHGLEHDRGAYSGESRLFRVLYHEGPGYLPMLLSAREHWLELEKGGRRPIFEKTGVLSIAADEAPELQGVKATAEAQSLPHQKFSTEQLRASYPQHGNLTDEIGILDELGGVLRPEAGVAEAQRQAISAGAEVLTESAVTAFREESEGVVIEHEGGALRAGAAVIAAGAWTPELLPQLSPALESRQIVLTWFAPDSPMEFGTENFPAFIRDTGGTHLFGVPTLDGALVKTGVGDIWDHLPYARTPNSLSRFLPPEELAPVGEAVHSLLPQLPARPSRHSVHMDLFTADKRALLGPVGERVSVAAGFSGHGFKLAPIFGQLALESALGHEPSYSLDEFDPFRFDA